MPRFRSALFAALLALPSLANFGCGPRHASFVAMDGAVLGRVVIYRNGVAFYERRATITNGELTVRVPRERVDDFLKSLTVVDPATRKPLAVTIPRTQAADGAYLTMTIETNQDNGPRRADVLLTYVTEAPAWKPSYRVVVGKDNKVMLEGWAIVDNTSGEDWKGVLIGVGASSALSFRYDLWSVRSIDRDLLAGEEKFAVAPPTGVSPYAPASVGASVADLDADEVRVDPNARNTANDKAAPASTADAARTVSGSSSVENQYYVDGINTTGVTLSTVGSTDEPAEPTSPTTGAIAGQVRDARTGERLEGVTVLGTSADQRTTQTAITDAQGEYTLPALTPGGYHIAFYYGDATGTHDARVAVAKTTPVFESMRTDGIRGETIQVQGRAPMIDATSTSQGITINREYLKSIPVPGRTFDQVLGSAAGSQGDSLNGREREPPPAPPPPVATGDAKLHAIVAGLMQDHRDVLIEAHGTPGTDAVTRARGEAVRAKLIDEGIPAARIHLAPKIDPGEHAGVRVLAFAPGSAPPPSAPPSATRGNQPDTPVGESHFVADRPMTVRAGTSAMVAMVHEETTGGVVYLFDPLSDRGDQRFAFKSVKLDNPTADTLEPGPVTVFGDDRFIGEGITEPVPPHASVVVPFALDRQIVVERTGADEDRISKLITVQRGTMTAEIQHRRQTTFTVSSRLAEPTTVYLRHRLEPGWSLVDAPSTFTKVGDSQLFELRVPAGETRTVSITEATPTERRLELASDEALGMMKLFVEAPDATPALRAQIEALMTTHRDAIDLVDKIATLRDQLTEYRQRAGELHGQLVTLKLVRTSGDLMTALRSKLVETSDRIQKATIAVVDTQEQLMMARVKFQNQLAELKLDGSGTPTPVASKP